MFISHIFSCLCLSLSYLCKADTESTGEAESLGSAHSLPKRPKWPAQAGSKLATGASSCTATWVQGPNHLDLLSLLYQARLHGTSAEVTRSRPEPMSRWYVCFATGIMLFSLIASFNTMNHFSAYLYIFNIYHLFSLRFCVYFLSGMIFCPWYMQR